MKCNPSKRDSTKVTSSWHEFSTDEWIIITVLKTITACKPYLPQQYQHTNEYNEFTIFKIFFFKEWQVNTTSFIYLFTYNVNIIEKWSYQNDFDFLFKIFYF